MRLVVVGATGAVGTQMLRILTQRGFSADQIVPVASARSAGRKLEYAGKELEVVALAEDVFRSGDLALFDVPDEVSAQWAPIAAAKGAIVAGPAVPVTDCRAKASQIGGHSEPGEEIAFASRDEAQATVAVQLDKPGPGRQRLTEAGLTVTALGDQVQISNVKFGSRAKKSGFEPGFEPRKLTIGRLPPGDYEVHFVRSFGDPTEVEVCGAFTVTAAAVSEGPGCSSTCCWATRCPAGNSSSAGSPSWP